MNVIRLAGLTELIMKSVPLAEDTTNSDRINRLSLFIVKKIEYVRSLEAILLEMNHMPFLIVICIMSFGLN